jgi:beta-galactosidase
VQTAKPIENGLKLTGKMFSAAKASCLDFTLTYEFYTDGVQVGFTYSVPESVKSLPRAGLAFAVDKGFGDLEFYGKGPYETYVDTAALNAFGCHKTTVEKNFANYIKPQECGSHCGTRYVALLNSRHSVEISAPEPFSFSALPYDAKTLRDTAHNWELPPSKAVYVSLDAAMRGIGSASCNPSGLNAQYEIPRTGGNTFRIKF